MAKLLLEERLIPAHWWNACMMDVDCKYIHNTHYLNLNFKLLFYKLLCCFFKWNTKHHHWCYIIVLWFYRISIIRGSLLEKYDYIEAVTTWLEQFWPFFILGSIVSFLVVQLVLLLFLLLWLYFLTVFSICFHC